MESLEYIFEKKFKYKPSDWTLPPCKELFTEYYQYENFQQLKKDLINVKSKLNDYPTEEWSPHTRKQDPCGKIPWMIKQTVQAEFVTIGWCKFFECLHQYPLVKDGNVNSLHLCEAPGAFITALNHYLQSTFDKINFNWMATTLNPYYEGNAQNKMIIDVRFMLHTLDNWIFCEDFSGNIMNRKNIEYMAKECKKKLGEVHLITADGSVDCDKMPDYQEEVVSSLHFSEVCTALLILSKGGSFVVKMFTLFEALSISMMYFLNCVFEEVNVFKPGTSKRGNSEVYVICLNYKRPHNIEDYLDAMLEKIEAPNIFPLFPKRHIPDEFRLQHAVCCRRFMHEQINAIESNIYAFKNQNRWELKKAHKISNLVCKMFLDKFCVQPIAPEQMLLRTPASKIQYGARCSQNKQGSYSDRQVALNMSNEEKIFLFCKELNEMDRRIIWMYDVMGSFPRTDEESVPLKLRKGKPVNKILSSLFAHVDILQLRLKLIELYGVDPNFQSDPHCALGDGQNPEAWQIQIENNLSEDVAEQQRAFFMNVLKTIIDHQPKRINFVNFPFLTHYSVSILRYLSANVYDHCQMSGSREVTLEIADFSDEAVKKVADIHQMLADYSDAFSFVDIMHLHRNQFSTTLIEFNNQLLLHNCKAIVNMQ